MMLVVKHFRIPFPSYSFLEINMSDRAFDGEHHSPHQMNPLSCALEREWCVLTTMFLSLPIGQSKLSMTIWGLSATDPTLIPCRDGGKLVDLCGGTTRVHRIVDLGTKTDEDSERMVLEASWAIGAPQLERLDSPPRHLTRRSESPYHDFGFDLYDFRVSGVGGMIGDPPAEELLRIAEDMGYYKYIFTPGYTPENWAEVVGGRRPPISRRRTVCPTFTPFCAPKFSPPPEHIPGKKMFADHRRQGYVWALCEVEPVSQG